MWWRIIIDEAQHIQLIKHQRYLLFSAILGAARWDAHNSSVVSFTALLSVI
jgi:hypothetical protein